MIVLCRYNCSSDVCCYCPMSYDCSSDCTIQLSNLSSPLHVRPGLSKNAHNKNSRIPSCNFPHLGKLPPFIAACHSVALCVKILPDHAKKCRSLVQLSKIFFFAGLLRNKGGTRTAEFDTFRTPLREKNLGQDWAVS